jgi:hypothetical protein
MGMSAFMIYCDGGIGNRITALLSGLAVARHFNLAYQVHWPVNNWCAAAFEDIFSSPEPISLLSLKDLQGQMGEAVMLLHDDIASKALGCGFASAYAYASMEDFAAKALSQGRTVFFYPALMPDWVPMAAIHEVLRSLDFAEPIRHAAMAFMRDVLQGPFHGIHLRRTDLTVGLTDLEVQQLVSQHRDARFYVCSDDPLAEALASAHPHVHCRPKTHHVEKKTAGEWTQTTADDDGRIYNGNIQRGRESVMEATIDMLILAQSQIVGFSGSTFQRMARLIGEIHPLLPWDKPAPLPFVSGTEIKRQLQARVLSLDALLQVCHSVGMGGRVDQAIEWLQEATKVFSGSELCTLLHTLAVFHLNQGQAQLARVHLRHVVAQEPHRKSSWLHLAYADLLVNDLPQASESMRSFAACDQGNGSHADQALMDFMSSRVPI